MTFRESIGPWFDANLLIGRTPNPAPNSEGNPALETGIAHCYFSWLKDATAGDLLNFTIAMAKLQVEPGLYRKKVASDDLLTHDDMIGICAASYAYKTAHARAICDYGMRNGWDFSNNGEHTWTSNAKPWHRAFYLIAGNLEVSLWDCIFLAVSIVFDAFFGMDDASGKRLNYLIVKTIKGKSFICDLAILLWWFRIKRTYGSARRIFTMYNGEKHPFSVYCPD